MLCLLILNTLQWPAVACSGEARASHPAHMALQKKNKQTTARMQICTFLSQKPDAVGLQIVNMLLTIQKRKGRKYGGKKLKYQALTI